MKSVIPKTQVVCYLEVDNYAKLISLSKTTGQTLSMGIDGILKIYFGNEDSQKMAVERLNRVIQEQEMKIRNLEHEIQMLKMQKAIPLREV